jgi:antitoxin HicB
VFRSPSDAMATTRYTVVLVPDEQEGGFVAYVPVIPGCVTQGETIEGAIAMAEDAAAALLASMADHGEDVPVESPGTIIAAVDVTVPEPIPA